MRDYTDRSEEPVGKLSIIELHEEIAKRKEDEERGKKQQISYAVRRFYDELSNATEEDLRAHGEFRALVEQLNYRFGRTRSGY